MSDVFAPACGLCGWWDHWDVNGQLTYHDPVGMRECRCPRFKRSESCANKIHDGDIVLWALRGGQVVVATTRSFACRYFRHKES